MSFPFDRNGEYRYQTSIMKPGGTDTFICGKCAGYRSISGRKVLSRDGSRVKYICLRCQKEQS